MLDTSDFAGARVPRHARADVDGDTGDLAVNDLALTGVQAGAYFEAELADGVDDRAGAADRTRGPVERGEEAVSCGVDLATAKPGELAAHEGVMALEQLSPGAVAELDRPVRRADDVREENGREHPVGLCLLPAAGLPDVGQEPLDRSARSLAGSPRARWPAPGISTSCAPGIRSAR